jgi:hypothetical protein
VKEERRCDMVVQTKSLPKIDRNTVPEDLATQYSPIELEDMYIRLRMGRELKAIGALDPEKARRVLAARIIATALSQQRRGL